MLFMSNSIMFRVFLHISEIQQIASNNQFFLLILLLNREYFVGIGTHQPRTISPQNLHSCRFSKSPNGLQDPVNMPKVLIVFRTTFYHSVLELHPEVLLQKSV